MDQAEAASNASFSLEPEKGITSDPHKYNRGEAQDNIKQIEGEDYQDTSSRGSVEFDSVSDIDLDEDESSVTPDDLQALNGIDEDEES